MEEKKKKSILTLIVVDAILLILVFMYIFDMIRASSFALAVVCKTDQVDEHGTVIVEPHKISSWLGDNLPGDIYVILTDPSGNPAVGHSVYALVEAGDGKFVSNRVVTDENGQATFEFTVPLKTAELWDVSPHKSEIKIYDEDNSVFFLVPKTMHITIDSRVPEGYSESNE